MKYSNIVSCILGVILGYSLCNISNSPGIGNSDNNNAASNKLLDKRPLKIFPLLKELGSGWKNLQVPPLIIRNATGTRSLVIDVGLDNGAEFFKAIDNGFEVVGFEPNPVTFPALSAKCEQRPKCQVLDLNTVKLPLKREEGYSYLINAAVGKEPATLELNIHGPVSSIVKVKGLNGRQTSQVKVVKMDDFIKEDVYLFKIDTQGFEKFVLEGAKDLFKNHVVRQVILEMDPFTMAPNNITPRDVLELLQDNGMMCFQTRTDNQGCLYLGESVEGFLEIFNGEPYNRRNTSGKCWEDVICLNIEKVYEGQIPGFQDQK